MTKIKIIVGLIFFLGLLSPHISKAYQPVIEPLRPNIDSRSIYAKSFKLEDPSTASLAVYGFLSTSEFDLYAFASHSNQTIPVELFVPAWPHNKNFHPSLLIFSKSSPKTSETFPVDLPEGYGVQILNWTESTDYSYEKLSQERLVRGIKFDLAIEEGKNYFFAISDQNNQKGEYVVALGNVENLKTESRFNLLKSLFIIKLSLFNQNQIPWLDILGLFLILVGFILAVGQDLKGRHGLKKYQFWIGFLLIGSGGLLMFRESWLSGVVFFEAFFLVIIVLNKLIFDFYAIPKNSFKLSLINKIISFLCWSGALFFLVWYLLMQR